MITSRLEIMRINGYLEERGGRYVLTPKGRTLVRTIRLVWWTMGVSYCFDTQQIEDSAQPGGTG